MANSFMFTYVGALRKTALFKRANSWNKTLEDRIEHRKKHVFKIMLDKTVTQEEVDFVIGSGCKTRISRFKKWKRGNCLYVNRKHYYLERNDVLRYNFVPWESEYPLTLRDGFKIATIMTSITSLKLVFENDNGGLSCEVKYTVKRKNLDGSIVNTY